MFVEGAPDDHGQLTHKGFCSIFGLKSDEYTERLVKIFDLDNSDAVGFREFIYGLSKFNSDTFERRLQFAYRLIDLDGDGSLDKFELNAAMKAALDTDRTQYNTNPPKHMIKMPFRARPMPDNPITPGNPNDLRGEVERIARNMGATRRMGFVEFQMLVARFPQIFQPAEVLYRLMHVNSRDASLVVAALSGHAMTRLMEGLGRFNVGDSSTATGFTDRGQGGPKYKLPPLEQKPTGGSASKYEVGRGSLGVDGSGSGGKPRRRGSGDGRLERASADAGTGRLSASAEKSSRRSKSNRTSDPGRNKDSPVTSGSGMHRVPSAPAEIPGALKTPRGVKTPRTVKFAETPRTFGVETARTPRSASISAELKTLMIELGLASHLNTLSRAEVLTVEDLGLMSEVDLKEIGLPKGPRLRVLDGVKAARRGAGGEQWKCKVCLDNPVQTVLKPCGHSLMCTDCAVNVKHCPVCRRQIDEIIRMFFCS